MTGARDDELRARARAWHDEDVDEDTRRELAALLDADDLDALRERFGASLEFGTAGLRGVLGAGPNRMSRAVAIRATAGFAAYLESQVADARTRGVVVGYDGRRKSREMAEDAAGVLAAAGFVVHLFGDLCPTPACAFTVLARRAAGGVMITASHNPPEYNGYKVYWGDGAQIVPPHDLGIRARIETLGGLGAIPRVSLDDARRAGLVREAGEDDERAYLDAISASLVHPEVPRDVRVAYTALHGVGFRLLSRAFSRNGFASLASVKEQETPDGTFPTVTFPNPEEPGAMDRLLALAEATQADVALANDPDADRLAAAVRDGDGKLRVLSGNELGVLLGHYLLTSTEGAGRLVIASIVSSPLLARIARDLGAESAEVLTGFKWIANRAMALERERGLRFVFGYEEALGYSVGPVVRDKDGISAALVFAELVAWCKARGTNVVAYLESIARTHGLYASRSRSVWYRGSEGAAAMRDAMRALRAALPTEIAGIAVSTARDLARGSDTLPPADLVVFDLADGARVMVRPSGTEPKLKVYVDVPETVADGETLADAEARGAARAARILEAVPI